MGRVTRLLGMLPPWIPGGAALLCWAGVLVGLTVRILLNPDRATNTARYLRAGQAWIDGKDLYIYTANKGFVYSPLCAAIYAATAWLPEVLATILWLWINVALLLGGLWALLNHGPFKKLPVAHHPWLYLLVFPLSLGNLDSAQANPIVIGFIMLAVAAAYSGRLTWSAIAVGGAVFWKVYPLAVGLLIVLLAPGRFSWRLALVLLAGALLPFLLQSREYVSHQYWLWFDTRTSDNRLEYELSVAPLDLWYLLVRFGQLPVTSAIYRGIQLTGAAVTALICLYGVWKKWDPERLYGALFAFACIWMTLLGPASELHAWIQLAPAAAFAAVECFRKEAPPVLRTLAWLTYVLLLLAILRVAFIPRFQPEWVLTLQPLAAVVFTAYCLIRFVPDKVAKVMSPSLALHAAGS